MQTTTPAAPRRRLTGWQAAELVVATPLVLAGLTGTLEAIPTPIFAALAGAALVMVLLHAVAGVAELVDGPKR